MKTLKNNPTVNLIMLMTLTFTISPGLLSAQSYQGERRITYEARNMRLADFFSVVWDQVRLQAFYNNEQLSSEERLTATFKDEPLDNVLALILRKRGLTWYYREETFVIVPRKQGDPLFGELPEEKTINVEGEVTDKKGTPLINASVVVKGQRKGTHTDVSGRFELTDLHQQASLQVSCLGYLPAEVKVAKFPLSIKLEPAVSGLDEVIVLGYGKTSKRALTGSVSRVTTEEIEQQPVSNPIAALQARVPGLHIVQLSGLPGSNFKVELRGRNSIGSGNNPLWILDGVPLAAGSLSWDYNSTQGQNFIPSAPASGLGANMSASPLNVINPFDIESIEVLKDADATAIYGSRGANGVILITTKKGKRAAKPAVAVNVYSGIGEVEHMVRYLNTEQYLAMRREAFSNDGMVPGANDHDVNGDWSTDRYTDWQKALIGGAAPVMDAQMSVSGGSDHSGYLVSGGFHQESTAYPGKYVYRKGGGRANLYFATPSGNFYASLNIGYTTDRNHLPAADPTIYSTTPPNAPAAYTATGTLNWQDGFRNPYAALLKDYKASTDNLLVSGSTGYLLAPWLELKTALGYNRMTMSELQTNPKSSENPIYNTEHGHSYFANAHIRNWLIEPQLHVDKSLGTGVKLNAVIGATFQRDLREQQLFYATGYQDDNELEDITAAGDIVPHGSVKADYRYNALFGRINCNLQGKYIVNLTGRRDGSSRFGPGREYANFGAVGAAWIFSEEPWMKMLPALSFGKLRISHGITGNDQIKDHGYLPGGAGAGQPALVNNDFSWELVRKSEVGLALGFLKDRVFLEVSGYSNRTSRQLIEDRIPVFNGYATVLRNMDAITNNTGLELVLSGTILKNKDLAWSSSLNFSRPWNKLVAFPKANEAPYSYYFTVGQPLNAVKGFHLEGVAPGSGLYQFEDRNKDGKITIDPVDGDFNYSVPLGVKFYGGLQNRIQYKGLQVDLLLQFVKQNGYDYRYSYAPPGPGTAVNQPATVLSRWQQPGDQASIQRFTQAFGSPAANAFAMALSSNQVITDASYIRLKNLSVAYALPAKWTKSLHLADSKIFFHGQNLLTLTRYPGRSPETTLNNLEVYPPLRIWTAGINLKL